GPLIDPGGQPQQDGVGGQLPVARPLPGAGDDLGGQPAAQCEDCQSARTAPGQEAVGHECFPIEQRDIGQAAPPAEEIGGGDRVAAQTQSSDQQQTDQQQYE